MTDEFPPVEEDCSICRGKGKTGGLDQDVCDWCDGTGQRPTEFGRQVLDMVRRNMRELMKDALEGRTQ